KKYRYVASSNGGQRAAGDRHYACAFLIDRNGALHRHGVSPPLPSRPLHISVDASGSLAMTTYNIPARVTVHRIESDGAFGVQVTQPSGLDFGIHPHQMGALRRPSRSREG